MANKVVSANIGERPTIFAQHDDIPDFASTVQRMFFVDDGKKMIISNPASSGDGDVAFYNLADSYDVRTSTLDSSKSLKTQAESTAAFTVGGTSYFNGRTNADLMFNDSGTEVTIHQGVSQNSNVSTTGNLYWRTFYLDSAFNLNTINNTAPLITTLPLNTFSSWHQGEYGSTLNLGGANHSKWADNGNKLVWYDINTNHMFAYNVPTPYNHQSINFYDDMNNVGDTADLFSFRDFDSGSWKDYMVSLNPGSGPYINFDDFHFNDSGTRMWSTNEGLEGHELWQFDLNTPWDLQSVDSASWELILYPSHSNGGGYGPDYGLDAITVTPTGLLYATSPRYVDSSGSQTIANHILGWDLTKDSNNRPYIFPADSDNSYFRSAATHLISTVETGLLYSNDPRTASTGNVFALAINEGILADSSYTTDSAYTVSIAQDDLYGGGYGNAFQLVKTPSAALAWSGDRAIVWGSNGGTYDGEKIEYFNIATPGNGTNFGDVHRQVDGFGAGKYQGTCVSDNTYGVYAGGNSSHNTNPTNQIDYVTIATPGNSVDFGTLTIKQHKRPAGGSDGTTGYIAGGQNDYTTNYYTGVHTFTIATPGNATLSSFNLSTGANMTAGANDATRMLILGGYTNGNTNDDLIQYLTFASAGTAQTFGNLSRGRLQGAAASDGSIALVGGGVDITGSTVYLQDTETVSIQTPGNATTFGDLSQTGNRVCATANPTYAVFTGGDANAKHIDRFTFATAGNATDHGDLVGGGQAPGCCSGNAA